MALKLDEWALKLRALEQAGIDIAGLALIYSKDGSMKLEVVVTDPSMAGERFFGFVVERMKDASNAPSPANGPFVGTGGWR